ncbi:organelle RRM domain-containing protein 6, chloroplastic [Macadamia integrifolia]|uniref:organelle RRM domain-containing protein 6, chloroplastic n=1 Tax=Macadamia integrifolia TaxID=60698 RepID=UPI001C4F3AB5|nr:organelle RRM domain-containing protein 6, chloroplastic [Macadamia integrifolia]XP_042502523.1 organelle RRM domain-containing protein 6, chloroplastic [Macadamia integrifolia]XP_042502524.1 organelle RRM domain-containing protein 6, chloroplastic [Macadamia integrifolia]
MAAISLTVALWASSPTPTSRNLRRQGLNSSSFIHPCNALSSHTWSLSCLQLASPLSATQLTHRHGWAVMGCLPSSSESSTRGFTKLYVSGLSFRTTEDSLRNAFQNFGNLVEVKLVMDRIANRPRGFAFLRYATEEESKKAIEGMHGKFLDGRVIFVEIAKPRSELRQKQTPRQY